jgi:ketosteroid isomerase-like protein
MIASRNQQVVVRIAVVSVAVILIAAAALRVHAQSAAQDEVLKLQKQFQDNCVAGNVDAVGAVLAEDAIYIHGNGVRHNKSELLALINNGQRSLAAFDLKEPKVILFDGGAIVSGLVDVAFRPPAGSTGASRVVHMLGSAVWIHQGGQWRLLLDQNTSIAPPESPPTAQ